MINYYDLAQKENNFAEFFSLVSNEWQKHSRERKREKNNRIFSAYFSEWILIYF